MVCNRCLAAVSNVMEQHGLEYTSLTLGELELKNQLSSGQRRQLAAGLAQLGFELIDDHKGRLIERIKSLIINDIHYKAGQAQHKYSELIAAGLHYDYPYLSKLFSEVEGVTIEQYIIRQKVEKIKEYIVYDELNLSAIADRMHYSSVAHLSAQFKKVTGMTPTQFKSMSIHHRTPLDQLGKQH